MDKGNFSFYGLGIAPKIIDIINRLKFKKATPIQHQAIPIALEGKDMMGIAQTGTGKTMAFAIPTVQRLMQSKGKCLVIVPTRELAYQVEESFAKISRPFGLKTIVIVGGAPIFHQIRALSKNPRILIATPGRLIDLMNQKKVKLNNVDVLVLDEADRMFDMGFSESIKSILKKLPEQRQTLLFSATMPADVLTVVKNYMKKPVSVEIAPPGTKAEHITHELFIIQQNMKKALLDKLLHQYRGSVLLFCRTKISVRKITTFLKQKNYQVAEIHSNKSLPQRRKALEGFKKGKFRILVATDIASRGIDIKSIELVINYDLPEDAENYVHRIGRTGRAGSAGHAISFATSDQKDDVENIERLIKAALPASKHPEIPTEEFKGKKAKTKFGRKNFGRARSRSKSARGKRKSRRSNFRKKR